MAFLWHKLSVVLAIVAFTNSVFAQETTNLKIAQHAVHKLYNNRYADVVHISSIDYDKIDSELLHQLAKGEGTPFKIASEQHGDLRHWLIKKAMEYKENQVKGTFHSFAETPLGNISQQCFDDVMKFFSDVELLQPYAMKSKCRSSHY